MRASRIVALCCAALAQAGSASIWAQSSSNTSDKAGVSFGVLAGATMPTGDYSKVANTGYHVGGFLDFGRLKGPVGLRADVTYNGFGDKDLVTTGSGTTAITFSNKYSMVNGNLNLVIGIPLESSPIRPYLIGGGGAYYVKNSPKCNGLTCATGLLDYGNNSNTKFGVNGGGGIEFGVASTSAFIEARFHNIFEAVPKPSCLGLSGCARSAAQLIPITFGIKATF